ncbi:hypothetical protein [Hydrogenophaga sp. IBVHS2]|jgi:hypothetical protein|uniref:hypothetical protein n=1 Tax=Hydrogenophaga sp. IBVHS2 TaxID=1985170 RepID=UPI000A2D032D|nr:hypothetical protein [Hydrogenophaga sp. IBVHS2]OSZ65791.1 hypothetical protein CAP38_07020 [Hydrogenophaga sp. IBVHS2]
MQAIKRVRKTIEADPLSDASRTFAALVMALESGKRFKVSDLYLLSYDDFEHAITLLKEWRLDRHYSSKFRLLDTSMVALDGKPEA